MRPGDDDIGSSGGVDTDADESQVTGTVARTVRARSSDAEDGRHDVLSLDDVVVG
jgi:hypothetical protein